MADDDDLAALREFARDEAHLDDETRTRIAGSVWAAVLDEDAARRDGRHGRRAADRGRVATGRSRWAWLQPAGALAVTTLVLGAVAMTTQRPATSSAPTASGGVTEAALSPLDSTARALFGGARADSTVSGGGTSAGAAGNPAAASDVTAMNRLLLRGPDGAGGSLYAIDPSVQARMRDLPRDPGMMLEQLRRAAQAELGVDSTDRAAFQAAMAWLSNPAVDSDVRNAALRAASAMAGAEQAMQGRDIAGRNAIVLSHFDGTTGIRDQTFIDPERGALLERRSYVATQVYPDCPDGTLTSQTVVDASGRVRNAVDSTTGAPIQATPACDH